MTMRCAPHRCRFRTSWPKATVVWMATMSLYTTVVAGR